MSITACILVKNESVLLRECLQGVADYVEEIVVIDSSTNDESKLIAEEYGCKVIRFNEKEYGDDGVYLESIKRNLYMKTATQQWLLVLDCDERIEKRRFSIIQDAIKTASPSTMGFCLPRYEYIGDGKWANNTLLRLVRNHPSIQYNNVNIHTSLLPSIKSINGTIEDIDVPIHHLDILLSDRAQAKRSIYREVLTAELNRCELKAHEKSDIHLFLGLEYSVIGDYTAGEFHYNRALELDPSNDLLTRIFLAQAFLKRGYLERAKAEIEKINSKSGTLRGNVLIILTEIAIQEGRLEDAIEMCQQCLQLNPNGSHLYINLASLIEDSNPQLAIQYLKQAIELNPYLKNPIIYKAGDSPNLYSLQSSFVSTTRSVVDHFNYCLKKLGWTDPSNEWKAYLDTVTNLIEGVEKV